MCTILITVSSGFIGVEGWQWSIQNECFLIQATILI